MIGLDLTRRVTVARAMINFVVAADMFRVRIAREALPHYGTFFNRTNGTYGIFVHYLSVIGWLLDPDLFTTRALSMRVEAMGITRVKTWPSLGDADHAGLAAWVGRPCVDTATPAPKQHRGRHDHGNCLDKSKQPTRGRWVRSREKKVKGPSPESWETGCEEGLKALAWFYNAMPRCSG